MKRVLYVLLILSLLCMILSGCAKIGDNVFDSDRFQIVSMSGQAWVIADNETGVLYLFVLSGTISGITPLLDGNGEVQFYQK